MRQINALRFTVLFILVLSIVGVLSFRTIPQIEPISEIEKMMVVVPYIEAYDESGNRMWRASGIWVDKIHVLTAAHVVGDMAESNYERPPQKADYWVITDAQGRKFMARGATIDTKHDVALLTLSGDDEYDGPVATFSNEQLTYGDELVCVGWMYGLGQEITWGRVANPSSDPNDWGEGDLVAAIVCTHGASGGAVFHDGKVIGVVSRGVDSLLIVEPWILFGLKI
jgi:S1-C subfamily serine protease